MSNQNVTIDFKGRHYPRPVILTVVETHDRIVGSTWREAKKICDARVSEAQAEIAATLARFETLGTTLLLAKGDELAVAAAVDASCGWNTLENLIATAGTLSKIVKADALAYVEKGYHRFKLYAPRMLAALDITGANVAEPLLAATEILGIKQDIPHSAVLFHPREASDPAMCGSRSPAATVI
ncbi:MAG: hypothetical protein ABJO67_01815 [Pseudoruegeria sp.]